MAGNRILLLGVPGVKKSLAAQTLAKKLATLSHKFDVVNFEGEYLWQKVQQRARFLDSPIAVQHQMWRTAWDVFNKRFDESKDYLLTMHGCFLDPLYGGRCVFDPGEVARKFKPTLVITLINDIYDAWSTTRSASAGLDIRGDPSLVQLLIGRRMELLVGDQIALAAPVPDQSTHVLASRTTVRNLMLSVNQPVTTFINAIVNPLDSTVAYLSFPISQPREMEARGDLSGLQKVSQFVRAAFDLQHQNHKLVVECPLMIDELPFCRAARSALVNTTSDFLEFDREACRWPLKDLGVLKDALLPAPSELQPFPRKQVLQALDLIDEDVTFRDYRLVDQADIVGVFNPILDPARSTQTDKDEEQGMAKSVAEEVHHALRWQLEVFLYQDPALDPNHVVAKELRIHESKKGQMKGEAARDYLVLCQTEDELLNNLQTGGLQP